MLLLIILGSLWIFLAIVFLVTNDVDDVPSFLLLVTPFNIITIIIFAVMGLVELIKKMRGSKERKRKKKLEDELKEKMRHIDPYGEENWADEL